MKVYNERGVVWNCLTEEEKNELIEASKKLGARTFYMDDLGWRIRNNLESQVLSRFAYKVEVPQIKKVRRYMKPKELFGKVLVNQKGMCFYVNYFFLEFLELPDGTTCTVEELSNDGWRLQPSGKPEFEGTIPLFTDEVVEA